MQIPASRFQGGSPELPSSSPGHACRLSLYRSFLLVGFASGAVGSLAQTCTAQGELDATRLSQRLERLHRVSIEYDLDVQYLPSEEDLRQLDRSRTPDGKVLAVRKGAATAKGEFWRDGEQWRYAFAVDAAGNVDNPLTFLEYVVSRSTSRAERLTLDQSQRKTHKGGIFADLRLPDDQYVDVGLGMRLVREFQFLQPARIADFVTNSAERLENSVVIVDGKGNRDILAFSSAHGYALESYEVYAADGRPFGRGDFSEFKDVDGVFIPHRMEWEFYHPDGQLYRNYVYRITSVELKTTHNFLIEWPLETSIYDERSGASIRVKSRPQRLSDEKLKEVADQFNTQYPEHSQAEPASRAPLNQNLFTSWLVIGNVAVLIVMASLFILLPRKR